MDLLPHFLVPAGLLLLALYLHYYRRPKSAAASTKEYLHKRQLTRAPEPPGALPFIGHLHLMSGAVPVARILADIADKYGGIFSLRLGSHQALVVSSWEFAKECFTTHDTLFASRPLLTLGKYMGYNQAMFALAPYGPYWRYVRKIVTLELFTAWRLEKLKHIRESEVDMCIKDLNFLDENDGGRPSTIRVNMNEWFEHLTFNIISRTLAGKRFSAGDMQSADDCFKEAIKRALYLSGIFVVSDAIPSLEWMDFGGHIRAMKQTGKEIDVALSRWLEEHKRKTVEGGGATGKATHQDFTDVMLSLLAEDTTISGFDRDTIIKSTLQKVSEVMDKSWMSAEKWSEVYVHGVQSFMKFVRDNMGQDCEIRCPCENCLNLDKRNQKEVLRHLLERGIDRDYIRWIYHGERSEYKIPDRVHDNDRDIEENDEMTYEEDDGVEDMLADLGNFTENNLRSDIDGNFINGGLENFEQLLNESQQELYPGCSKASKLSFIIMILHLKVFNKWSKKSVDMLLAYLKSIFPKGEVLPNSEYEAKKVLQDLGLGYVPIHACKYDCALFWKEFENRQECPVCGTSRWKLNDTRGKKIPHKILRYFPLKPRLQRLFMSSKTATDMRWHKNNWIDDKNLLRHPSDSKAWKELDKEYPWFAEDPRNVRLGLATDGFNPFGNMSNSYSMWPVILIPYNLPPWKCMKESFFMMSLLIPGPQAPGKDIDVYMQPLIEELKELWTNGVLTYDAASRKNFQMHAAVLWTINDFPAYGNLSGWSTKGYLACPVCNKHTYSQKLRSKICYMGHRRYLPRDHCWRKSRKFNGKAEYGMAHEDLSSEDVLHQLKSINVTLGKHPNNKKRKRNPEELNWTKRSIFFQLPYWKNLKLRHNLDVMHVEKNICENILGTLFNIEGKTKDTLKARQDLEDMKIRKELHLKKRDDGSYTVPPACYTLSKEEKQKFCEFLKSVKFPDSYASNISRCANVSDGKISGLKSHDCHVLLQRLLPCGIRGYLSKDVSNVLVELGDFFKRICCKTLKIGELETMQQEIALILCKLEMIFPPAFFDVMVHLAIHLPNEAILGGPIQYRWMFPIERFLGTLKSYVRNRACPEGSIAEAYIVNECLTFCSMYLQGIETQFNQEERNYDVAENGGLPIFSQRFRPIGGEIYGSLTEKELNLAHWYVLNNCEEAKPYIEMHNRKLEQENAVNLDKSQKEHFPSWFRQQITHLYNIKAPEATEALYSLACGPQVVMKYTGCIINGVRFHVQERDSRLRSQNSGVVVEGNHGDDVLSFYGVLKDIIQIDYIKEKKVILFKCDWFDVSNKRSCIQKDGSITSINVTKKWYQHDPFVLASQVNQVFYINDMKLGENWKIVQRFRHRHVYDMLENENIDAEEDNANDEVRQDGESLGGVAISIEDHGTTPLLRDDVNPSVVEASGVHSLGGNMQMEQEADEGNDLMLDDDTEDDEDDTTSYCSDNEELEPIDEYSDLEL